MSQQQVSPLDPITHNKMPGLSVVSFSGAFTTSGRTDMAVIIAVSGFELSPEPKLRKETSEQPIYGTQLPSRATQLISDEGVQQRLFPFGQCHVRPQLPMDLL